MADLREKLEKLVEEWREDIKHVLMSAEDYSPRDYAECRAIKGCADQLAAILAESGPPSGKLMQPYHDWSDEPLKPLPLGHPYSTFVNGNGPCTACIPTIVSPPGERPVREAWRCCGQPRSAHEPLPAPLPKPAL